MTINTISIIGAGSVGQSLGEGWASCGYDIVFGVRTPDQSRYDGISAKSGDAEIVAIQAAVSRSDVIVLAIPWAAAADTVKALDNLKGKTIIDATNPLIVSGGAMELEVGFSNSGAEELALLEPNAYWFKAMNQVGFSVMSDTHGYCSRPVMFIAGDNEKRKIAVNKLVSDLGFEARNAGPLKSARLLEPYAMLWIEQATKYNAPLDSAFAFLKKSNADEIVEYIRYELKSHASGELLTAYSEAVKYLQASEECLGYQLSQCTESSESIILRIHWKSADAHMSGFRGSDLFPPFLKLVRPFIDEISEMRHYAPTSLEWFR